MTGDGLGPIRGLMYAIVPALALWAVLIAGGCLLWRAVR